MADPDPVDLSRRLRELRHREFEALRLERLPEPASRAEDTPLASALCLLVQPQDVLDRIDQAQVAMERVLQAWDRDPARRGAHLLARDGQLELPLDLEPAPTMPGLTEPADAEPPLMTTEPAGQTIPLLSGEPTRPAS